MNDNNLEEDLNNIDNNNDNNNNNNVDNNNNSIEGKGPIVTTEVAAEDGNVVVVIGLDNAGKTTLATALEQDDFKEGLPITISPEAHIIDSPRVPLKSIVYDLGGQTSFREGWEIYFAKAAALVFVVDSACVERFEEAKEELAKIVDADWLIALRIPILILGNKTDLAGAATESELVEALSIQSKLTGKTTEKSPEIRPLEIFMCSLKENEGYIEAFDWLNTQVSPKARACAGCIIL